MFACDSDAERDAPAESSDAEDMAMDRDAPIDAVGVGRRVFNVVVSDDTGCQSCWNHAVVN
jgi:hypothetical protein